jgi:hypothetical protein
MSDVFFVKAGRLAARKVAGEVVILRADDSSLYVLNGVGTAVWDAADGHTPVDALVRDVICRDFDVDVDIALRDVSEFIAALTAQGVLRTSDRPMATGDAPAAEGVRT